MSGDVLVLGLGNVLCQDVGAGVAAVAGLNRGWTVGPGATVLDGGTLGLSLLPWLLDAEATLFVDAVGADAPPGTLVRLEGEAVAAAVAHRLSAHQVGVGDLMHAFRLLTDAPRPVVLLGVVPAETGLGLGRTPAVDAAIPALIDGVVDELRRWGCTVSARAPDPPGAVGVEEGLRRVLGL